MNDLFFCKFFLDEEKTVVQKVCPLWRGGFFNVSFMDEIITFLIKKELFYCLIKAKTVIILTVILYTAICTDVTEKGVERL